MREGMMIILLFLQCYEKKKDAQGFMYLLDLKK